MKFPAIQISFRQLCPEKENTKCTTKRVVYYIQFLPYHKTIFQSNIPSKRKREKERERERKRERKREREREGEREREREQNHIVYETV